MNRVKLLFGAIVISLLLTACPTRFNDYNSNEDKRIACPSPSQNNPSSELAAIDIYIDGSGSMLGYVAERNSRYIQILRALDRILTLKKTSTPEPTVTPLYYRSGSTEPISRSDFLAAKKQAFYDGVTDPDRFRGVTSALDTVITAPEDGKDRLFVMVTDLYQDENDSTKLTQKIQETYLSTNKKGYAVGILAIKSEFSGTVYVVGNRSDDFFYDTQGRPPEELRPFYVLFLGPYDQIADRFDKLYREEAELLQDSKSVIFAPHNLVSKPSYIGDPKFDDLQSGLKQPYSLNNGSVAIELEQHQKIELLEIDRNANDGLEIDYSVDLPSGKFILPIDSDSIETKIKIEAFDPLEKKFQHPTNNSQLQEALSINGWNIGSNKLSFTTNLQPSNFPESNVYFFNVEVVAKGLETQNWWEEWNWNLNRDSKTDGSKTLGLSNFMKGLRTVSNNLIEENPPAIARLCYAVQKN